MKTTVVLMGVIFFVQQLLGSLQDVLGSTLARRVEGDLRTRVFRALAKPRKLDHLDDPEVRDKVAAASTVGTARYGIGAAMSFGVPAINAALFGAWMAVLLAMFSWWLAILVVALCIFVRMRVHREAVAYLAVLGFQTAGSQRAVYFRDLGLTPAAAKEIRVFGLADWVVGRFRDHWSKANQTEVAKRADIHVSLWLTAPIVLVYMLGFVSIVTAARTGSIDLRQFAVAVQALLGVSILGVSWRDEVVVTFGAATVPPVWELEAIMAKVAPNHGMVAPLPRTELRFEGVEFRYPGRDAPVLSKLDLDIPLGRSTAIVGVNGAGKTTLIKLLCGLIAPAEGCVRVDGIRLDELDPDAWRRNIAVLFQDFAHYPFSAADNVLFGAVDHLPQPGDLDRIARRAGLVEVIDGLPRQWETPLSRQFSGGSDISGGQWQRVALARALWAIESGAQILILDEPTANLDVRAEARFYEQFLDVAQGLTTILISHRFASVRQADNIVVISGGRVAEIGRHNDLMGTDTLYSQMFAAQTAIYATEMGDA